MKRFILIPLAMALVVGLIFGGCAKPAPAPAPTPAPAPAPAPPPAPPAEVIELKFSHEHSVTGGKYVRGHEPWAKMVEEATKGRVKITQYPANALSGSKERYDDIIGGIGDIGWTAIPHYPGRFPLTEATSMPGLGVTSSVMASHIVWNLYQEFPEGQAEFADVKVLFMHAFAPISIATTKVPIRSLDDMKGLQLRAPGGGQSLLTEAAGASPMLIMPGDIYLNLEKGVIDGSVMGWEGHGSFGTLEIANYFTVVPAYTGPHFVMYMNLDKWNSLPADVQEAIMSVSGDVGSQLYAEGDDQTSQINIDKLLAMEGKEIIALTPEEAMRWEALCKPIQDKWVADLGAKGLPGKAFLDEAMRLAKEYQG